MTTPQVSKEHLTIASSHRTNSTTTTALSEMLIQLEQGENNSSLEKVETNGSNPSEIGSLARK